MQTGPHLDCLLAWIVLAAVALAGCDSGDGSSNPSSSQGSTTQQAATPPSPSPSPLPSPQTSGVTLDWTAPTENTDGTVLADLSGYRIYYGTDPSQLDTVITIATSGLTTFVVDGLTVGTKYFFVMTALATDGTESAPSNLASKVIS